MHRHLKILDDILEVKKSERRRSMNHSATSSASQDLARQLLAYESSPESASLSSKPASIEVCDKIRTAFVTLMGGDAFQALLGRALKLAQRDSADLHAVTINDKGSMEGLSTGETDAGGAVVASLLSLLVTFIGETLTLRLLYDVWPTLNTPDLDRIGRDQ